MCLSLRKKNAWVNPENGINRRGLLTVFNSKMQLVRKGESVRGEDTKLHFTSCPFTTLLDLFEVILGNLRDLVLTRSIALSNLGERTFCWDAPILGSLMET